MSTKDLFSLDAEEGSEDDESFDEDTGDTRRKTKQSGADDDGGLDDEDSSEEEDDDDEEAAAAIREGFIVDEDEEDEDERKRRRKEKRKRRREEREDEALDDEDLDLIGELEPAPAAESKFKRLKRGHQDSRRQDGPRGIDDIFSDDENDAGNDGISRRMADGGLGGDVGEFDDFIEEDEFPDDERDQMIDDIEVARPKRGLAVLNNIQSSGLDEAAQEDMLAAFGDGGEYDWALKLQEAMDDELLDPDKPLELKDVFEPSQLADRMLTDEDNLIRSTDVPERFQLARKPFPESTISDEEAASRAKEEAKWITSLIWPRKDLDSDLLEPFQKSVGRVLEFMKAEDYEVPFIFQHRKDYLIHESRVAIPPDPRNPDAPEFEVSAVKMLDPGDLWQIFELDLKFSALMEKREALNKAYAKIQSLSGAPDDVVDDMLIDAVTMEEVQDIQDYVHFQYSAELKDVNTLNAETNGVQKRAQVSGSLFEGMRAGPAYNLVRAFGITPDAFAQNALESSRRKYTEDPTEMPDDMADKYIDQQYPTGAQVLRAAKAMYAEELARSPRMKKLMRQAYFMSGQFDCIRTEKGLKKIDEDHPYYEFKYLRNQTLIALARKPELFLKMLKAEQDGLIEFRLRLDNSEGFTRKLRRNFESDNFSEIADAWNVLRREVLDMALAKLEKVMVKQVKENMKVRCEDEIARICRKRYSEKLDQAPYKPKGMVMGEKPRVLALSNGTGVANRDAICWVWVEHDGRVLENGKYTDLRPSNPDKGLPAGKDVASFIELVERRKPDVIAVSGFSVETRVLYKDLQAIIDQANLCSMEYEDEDGNTQRDKLDVVTTNDEVARLYHTSERAAAEYPGLAPLTRYCVALARYLQDPMKEYASLGRDVTSITFDPSQNLIPQDKLVKHLETAMVDMVNLVGVDVNEAVSDPYTANLLPYVCGLGPRKAAALIQAVNRNGGEVLTRDELVGDPENNKLQAVGPKVWANCASFLYIPYDRSEPTSDYLDNTRVHPEDYDLGRKMAADALELDEEDIKGEVDEGGPAAVVRKLINDDAQEKVNDLILEMYAEQLERNFNQRKRATLETIRAELQEPYEELRHEFNILSHDEIFTMLTGETAESLCEGMTVPVTIRKILPDHIEARLDCGIEGSISESAYPAGVGIDGTDARRVFAPHQTVQAKLNFINRKTLTAQLSLREEELRRVYRKEIDRPPGEWDEEQEEQDKRDVVKRTEQVSGRAQRVIKHPLFRPFNATQAEEHLGPQGRGDVVIRPSSKGLDHLAVTWKVSDNVFQHIDVLELDKENEFSVGRVLRIGGRYTYTDLDELIVNHVKAMAKKVDEMVTDEKYQTGSKAQTEQWLTAYMEANPKRSMYAFCINREYPGYFYLCFKAGQSAKQSNWPVKIIPNAFELQKNPYPDMRALKNGFKTLFTHQQQNGRRKY